MYLHKKLWSKIYQHDFKIQRKLNWVNEVWPNRDSLVFVLMNN